MAGIWDFRFTRHPHYTTRSFVLPFTVLSGCFSRCIQGASESSKFGSSRLDKLARAQRSILAHKFIKIKVAIFYAKTI